MLPGSPRRGRHRHPLTPCGEAALALSRVAVLAVGPQRAAQFLTKSLAIVIALGITGLIAFFIVADERRGRAAEASVTQGDELLASRTLDPTPLTLQEVFPDDAEVHPPGSAPAYPITMTHIDNDCTIATVGSLGADLAQHGCTQVVRASLTAPYGDYQVTAGLFNLADVAGANAIDQQLRGLVESGAGNFAAMAGGAPGTDPSIPPASQVGWQHHGHYLLYCVITRPHGELSDHDPHAEQINSDLVDGALSDVLSRRAAKLRS